MLAQGCVEGRGEEGEGRGGEKIKWEIK